MLGSTPRRLVLLALVATACARHPDPGKTGRSSAPATVSATTVVDGPKPASVGSTRPAAAGQAHRLSPMPVEDFARSFRRFSEPGEYFFSNNAVSNETSYLQVAQALLRRESPGGAYLGVGPEQNFTYIALTRPELAFIVDLRRDNALLHLLYKAVFHEARSRAEFLTLLLGRPYQADDDPGIAADVTAVLRHAKRHDADAARFRAVHARLSLRLTHDFRLPLTQRDLERIEALHRTFFDEQLALEFELHQANGRDYPSLESLLTASDPSGQHLGFLATREHFETVQRLQRQHRIIPVVGDFAGKHALRAVAAELARLQLPLSTFYVSNVEQYLMGSADWRIYVENLRALPWGRDSVFIRCYLDQGRRHPAQLDGHRTATVLQPWSRFARRQRGRDYGSFWELATD